MEDLDLALVPAVNIMTAVRKLRFEHENPDLQYLQASIGVGPLLVGNGIGEGVAAAADAVQAAKKNRNSIFVNRNGVISEHKFGEPVPESV